MTSQPRIGGYVIHGNAIQTLEPCLDSLLAVCDEVVAVDSKSTDGSLALSERKGAKTIVHPWRGFGAARKVAAQALSHCDYIFFLDSDEFLEPWAQKNFQRWRQSQPTAPMYRVFRQDFAELGGRRFLFRHESHLRLVKPEFARWQDDWIVHEALGGIVPDREIPRLDIGIHHRFATSVEEVISKQDRYALLWALRAQKEEKRLRPIFGKRISHMIRNGIIKGAFLRGGMDALRLAWAVSRYHALKYKYLRAVKKGKHEALWQLYRQGRLAELFAALS